GSCSDFGVAFADASGSAEWLKRTLNRLALPGSTRQLGRPRISALNQLGNDAHRDLRHRLRANVETERSVHTLQCFLGNSFRFEVLEDHPNLSLAADHADVAAFRGCEVVDSFFVVAVAASENHGE